MRTSENSVNAKFAPLKPHSPTPIGQGRRIGSAPGLRVLCAKTAGTSEGGLRRLGWGYAKGRSPVAWELRPHDRSRCAEHGEGVHAPPGVVMFSPPTP